MSSDLILQGVTLEQLAKAVADRIPFAEEPTMTLDAKEAARHLRCSVYQVNQLIESGVLVRIPTEVSGRRIVVTRASVEAAAQR